MSRTPPKAWIFVILIAIFGWAYVYFYIKPVNPWIATHWAFSYEYGFIKRGLVGTVYQIFKSRLNLATINYYASILSYFGLFLTLATIVYLSKIIYNTNHFQGSLTYLVPIGLSAWLISSPGLAVQHFYDLGRFDVLGYILICMSVNAIIFLHKNTAFLFLLITSTLSIVIHEGQYFWTPWILLSAWYLFNLNSQIPTNSIIFMNFLFLVLFFLFMTIMTAAISTKTYANYFSLTEALDTLNNRSDFNLRRDSLLVHFFGLSENLEFTADRSWSPRRIAGLITSALILIPYIWFFGKIYLTLNNKNLLIHAIVFLGIFAPLGLFILGHDQGRWMAMINANLIFMIAIGIVKAPQTLAILKPKHCIVLIGFTFLQLMVGPYGVTATHPEFVLLDKLFP